MSPAVNKFLLFFMLVAGGVLLEVIVHKLHCFLTKQHYKENHFTFRKYIFLLLFPFIATFTIAYLEGWAPLVVFVVFSFIGTLLEGLVGFSYHKVVGQRLWTYHKYSLTGYTSLLSIPLWGMAGVLFWLLARIFV